MWIQMLPRVSRPITNKSHQPRVVPCQPATLVFINTIPFDKEKFTTSCATTVSLLQGHGFLFAFNLVSLGNTYACVADWENECLSPPPRICQQNHNQRLLFFSIVIFFCCWQHQSPSYKLFTILWLVRLFFDVYLFFLASCALVFSRLKMKTLHGEPGEHRSHLHVAVFFLRGRGFFFFLFRLGVRLHFFLSSGGFFCPQRTWLQASTAGERTRERNITEEGGNCTKNPVSLLFHFLILLCTCFFLQGGCLLFLTFLIPGWQVPSSFSFSLGLLVNNYFLWDL